MKIKINWKALLPHAIAIGVFILMSSIYFSPVWNGRQVKQADVSKYQGAAKEITDYRLLNNDEALWTNSMFGGMPAYQISTEHQGNWIAKVGSMLRLGLPAPVGILFVSFLGFYILALCMRISPYIALVGALASGFASFNLLYIGAGHITKVIAVSYMAPTLGGMLLAFRGKWLLGGAVFALFLALNISANHLQITYYLFIMLGVVALAEAIRLIVAKQFKELLKVVGVLGVSTILSVLPSASNLMTTYEYAKYSTRGDSEISIASEGTKAQGKAKSGLEKDYILEYNYGPGEFLSLMIPNAKGGSAYLLGMDESAMSSIEDSEFAEGVGKSNHYWGEQAFSGGAIYIGAVAGFLFILGLFLVKDSLRFPFFALAVLCILLSSKTGELNLWFIDHFPMYNKFRDTKMILVIMQVIVPLMGMLLLDKLVKKEGLEGTQIYRLIVVGTGTFLMISLFLVPSLSGSFISKGEEKMFQEAQTQQGEQVSAYKSALIEARQSIYRSDAGRTAALCLLSAGLVVVLLMMKFNPWIAVGVFGVLIAGDQIGIGRRYLSENNVTGEDNYVDKTELALPYAPSNADLAILARERSKVPQFNAAKERFKGLFEEQDMYTEENREVMAEFSALQLGSNYRVITSNNPFNETNTSFFHKSIGGYHGAKIKRYQQVVEFYLNKELSSYQNELFKFALMSDSSGSLIQQWNGIKDPNQQGEFVNRVLEATDFSKASVSVSSPVLDMMNAQYLITGSGNAPYFNAHANGNAWFVNEVVPVGSANDALQGLGKINTRRQAIWEKTDGKAAPAKAYLTDSNDRIQMTKYATKEIQYTSQSAHKGFAVFSEIYYPDGWKCYIDGKEMTYTRVNFILRGVEIPAGKHQIVWRFEPESYLKGSTYSMIGSLVLLLGFLGITGLELRNWRKSEK
jgi:hypothetical protein